MSTYVSNLANARHTHNAAIKALVTAKMQSAPMAPELAEMAMQRNPQGYAECIAKMTAIAETIPALEAEVKATGEALAELEATACTRCMGTGEYGGASRYHRYGQKYCFGCNGKGHK